MPQNRIIFPQFTKREVAPESALSCFPTGTKFTLTSLKNTICTDDRLFAGLGHRLLLWDGSLLEFFWVTGTICPSVWGKAGWSEWSPGTLFGFLFGIPELASVAGWRQGWFRISRFVPCSAANPGHNLLWFTSCVGGDVFCCKAGCFRVVLLLVRHVGLGVACFSPLLVQKLDFLLNTQ